MADFSPRGYKNPATPSEINDPAFWATVGKNQDSRWLEIKKDSEGALATSTEALSTLGTVRNLAEQSEQSAASSAQSSASANQAVIAYDPRITGIEAMAGLTPESPTDGQTSNLISNAATLTYAAVSAQSAEVAKDTLATQTFTGTGTGDQAGFTSAVGSLSSGETLLVRGTVALSSTVTLDTPDTGLRFAPGAKIITTVSASDVLTVTAPGVSIDGGTIESPAVWDGANVAPTYAVVHVKAENVRVAGLRLVNVPKVGIYFDDVQTGTAEGNRITGNYPAASWTGMETGHFGIAYNPAGADAGRLIITGNHLKSCVQGLFMGAYGGTSPTYGVVISGNIFDGCHNHGVYSSFGVDAAAVTGNTFTRCSMPVAMTGAGHAITGNTMYTHATGSNLDVAGISLREPVGCAITGNTIRGDVLAGQVAIELGNYLAGSVEVSRNTITGNTIELTAGAGVAIRVGRAGQTTICNDNVVSNNAVRGLGQVNVGLVTVAPSAGTAYGNKVDNNTIVIRGNSHGVYLINANHTTVSGNTIRFEYNAAAATTVAGVRIYDSRGVTVRGNSFLTATGYGANLSVRAIWEAAGSTLGKYGPNAHDPLNAAAYTSIVTVAGTNCFVDESGTGDPNGAFFASAGSRWARTDGTAGTSLYVKETASTAASGWVGK